MEQQNYKQINKRINILIGVAGVAMIVGLIGLVVGLMRPTMQTGTSPSTSIKGSLESNSPYQEVIIPDNGARPQKDTPSSN